MITIKVIPKLSLEGEVILFYPEVNGRGGMDIFTTQDRHSVTNYDFYKECKLIKPDMPLQTLDQLYFTRHALTESLPFTCEVVYIKKVRKV